MHPIAIVTLICVGACVFLLLRARHRSLFARLQDLNHRLCFLEEYAATSLRDDVRVLQRLRRIDAVAAACGDVPRQEIDPFTSQSREDILIYDFFQRRGSGFFVEAGAYDGIAYSTSYLLERIGWTGLLVEPIPHKAECCRRNRPRSHVVQAALGDKDSDSGVEFTFAEDPRGGGMLSFLHADHAHVERCRTEQCELRSIKVPLRTLNTLLTELTQSVDFLSLDLEGAELEALNGLDLSRYRPKLILVERQESAGDEAVLRHLSANGYVRSATKGSNYFFVLEEFREEFEAQLCDDERVQ